MPPCSNRRLGFWFVGLLLLGAGSAASAQEIPFLTDYARARAMAASTNRPLFLCVVEPGSPECLRLEAVTLRDRTVAEWVGQGFVAVKIDPVRDAALVQALHISHLPVTVLAAPDGTILHAVTGCSEPAAMARHLELGLTRLQYYRAGIHPASVPATAPATQTTSAYYGSPSPYGTTWQGGTWTPDAGSYLSNFPNYFPSPRRC